MGFVIVEAGFFCTVRRNDFASGPRPSFEFLAEQGPRNVHGNANAARQDAIRDAVPPTPIPPDPLCRRETELATKYSSPFHLEFTGAGICVRILNDRGRPPRRFSLKQRRNGSKRFQESA